MKVIFVCEGNTCRSPMLEFALKRHLNALGASDIDAESRGLHADKKPLSPYCEAVLSAHAIPYKQRLSIAFSAQDLSNADVVIAVTARIADVLREKYANDFNTDKIYSLYDIANCEVADPYGKGLEEYEKTYKSINGILPELLNFLIAYKDDFAINNASH